MKTAQHENRVEKIFTSFVWLTMDEFVSFIRGILSQMNMTVFWILTAAVTIFTGIFEVLLVNKNERRFWDLVQNFTYVIRKSGEYSF